MTVLAAPARAHHGKDFHVLETTDLPEPRSVWVFASGDIRAADGRNDEETLLELTPGLLLGIAPWGALEVHPHIGKEEGEGLSYEATGTEIRLAIPAPRSLPLTLGLAAEYEWATGEASDAVSARLILASGMSGMGVAANLGFEKGLGGEEPILMGGLGLRRGLLSGGAVALEVIASSGQEKGVDLIPSWTAPLMGGQALRVGAGVGLGGNRPRLSLRTVYVVGF